MNQNILVQEAHCQAVKKADSVVPSWNYGSYEHQHWLHVYEDMYQFYIGKLQERTAPVDEFFSLVLA